MKTTTVGLVQMCAGAQVEPNVDRAIGLAEEALEQGADLAILPEGFAQILPPAAAPSWAINTEDPSTCPVLGPATTLSRRFDALLILGGVPEREGLALYNSLIVLHRGRPIARYRKIHQFRAHVGGTILDESASYAAGDRAVVLDSPWGKLGMSICYDLRFPELYRRLAAAGSEMIAIPSAFTRTTGEAHWEVLVRARAIESRCFVLAPAQYGSHGGGRHSFGHTMIVDPWGVILATAPQGDTVVTASLDPARISEARDMLPTAGDVAVTDETTTEFIAFSRGDSQR